MWLRIAAYEVLLCPGSDIRVARLCVYSLCADGPSAQIDGEAAAVLCPSDGNPLPTLNDVFLLWGLRGMGPELLRCFSLIDKMRHPPL
jgi:hypothetical protein